MEDLVKRLTETYGPSGFEGKVRDLIQAEIKDLVDEMRIDALGNLITLKKGKDSSKKALVAAHMDEIGLMVKHVDKKGYMRFTNIGGVSPRGLPGARVLFENGVTGGIGIEHLEDYSKAAGYDKMFIDVGARDKKSSPVGVGDAAVLHKPFVAQQGRWIAKAFDDRIGCAVLIETLKKLDTPAWDTYLVFTAQEEVGVRGARVSAFAVDPDYGIAVDVTGTGDTPESLTMAVELGKGPAIKVMDRGMLAHRGIKDWMVKVAEELEIPYQLEVLERGSTDALAIQAAREGVPSGVLSIPTRHVHSGCEMVDEEDVTNAIKLLAELLSRPAEF